MATSKEIETLALPDNSTADLENIINDMVFSEKPWKLKTFCCIKCNKVALDHSIANCAHVFCKNCFQHVLDRSCPECQLIIIEKYEDHQFKSELMQLKVECINKKTGCKDILMLSYYKTHVENCAFSADSSVAEQKLNKLNGLITVQQTDLNAQFSEIQKIRAVNKDLKARLDKIQKTTAANQELNIQEFNLMKLRTTSLETSLCKNKVRLCCQQSEDTNNEKVETSDALMILRNEVNTKFAKLDKQIAETNSWINDVFGDLPQKIVELLNKQVEGEVKSSKDKEIVLPSKWWEKEDDLDKNVLIFNFTIPNLKASIKKGIAKPYTTITNLNGSMGGLKFEVRICISKNIENFCICYIFEKCQNFEAYLCKLILLDQSENTKKSNVVRIFQINNIRSIYGVNLCPLNMLNKNSLIGYKEIFVKNDSIAIKMVFPPISYIYKSLSFKNGVVIWQIPDYFNVRKNVMLDEKCHYLESHAFYTGEFGYKMRARLYLNGYPKCDTEYIAVEINFIQGEFDTELYKTFSYKARATLLNQKDLGIKKDICHELQYCLTDDVSKSDQIETEQKRFAFKQFVRRQPSFLKCNFLLFKIKVNIVDVDIDKID